MIYLLFSIGIQGDWLLEFIASPEGGHRYDEGFGLFYVTLRLAVSLALNGLLISSINKYLDWQKAPSSDLDRYYPQSREIEE